MPKTTPLLEFLRAFPTKSERITFANFVGTTEVYLYQLAAAREPNPRLRLAFAIVNESKRYAQKFHVKSLRLEDLLVGTADGDDATGPNGRGSGPHLPSPQADSSAD